MSDTASARLADAIRSLGAALADVVEERLGAPAPAPALAPDDLLTVEEGAAAIRWAPSELRAQVAAGRIEHVRLGKVKGVRIRRSVLDAFVASRTVKPRPIATALRSVGR